MLFSKRREKNLLKKKEKKAQAGNDVEVKRETTTSSRVSLSIV